ncbi:hypothetical protein FS749_005841, partial [Ceratobasidium sp. UAMH 11750]
VERPIIVPKQRYPACLASVLDTPPPTTSTLLGTERGKALYDTPPPAGEGTDQVAPTRRSKQSQRSSPRKRTLTERGADFFGKIKDSQFNPGTILKDNALKLTNFISRSKSSLGSADDTDGRESSRTVDTGASGVPGLPSNASAPLPARDPDHPTASSRGPRTGGTSKGSRATGLGDATRTGGRARTTTYRSGAGTSSRGPTSAPATPAAPAAPATPAAPISTPAAPISAPAAPAPPSPEPKHRNLFEGEYSERSDYIETLDPAALVAHLAEYIDYDASQLTTQDVKALLRAYVQDHTPSLAPPKQQASTVVSQDPIHVGGGYHADQLMITGSSRSAKRPSSPPVNQPPKRHKVTVEEVDDIDANTNTETETETDTDTDTETETETNTDTIPESDDDVPIIRPRDHANTGFPDFHRTASQSSHQASQRYQPTTTSSISLGQASYGPNQANSHVHSQQSATSRAAQCPPGRPPTFTPATATSSSGMPPIRASSGNPTEREREMRARAKVADRMARVEAKPKRAHRGLRLPGKLSKKTAKLFSVVYGAYRKLIAAASAKRPTAPKSSGSRGNIEDDLMSDGEVEGVAQAAEAAGQESSRRRRRKPSSQDVHGYEKLILTTAKLHLFAITLVEGAYQTRAWLMKVAKIVFIETWRQELPEVPLQLPSEEVLQVMVNNLATARGQVKLVIRPMMEHGFEFLKWDSSAETINRNLKIFSTIHPNAFHCLEFNPMYGHYESSLLTKAIAAALFGGPNSVGVTFRDYFEPMPLTAVAFILANMQFCIEEWETGQWVPRDLSTSDMLNKYVAHLRGLKEARAAARGRMARSQGHWFDFGFEYSGATPLTAPIYQPITLRSEVRPDTPITDDDNSMISAQNEQSDSDSDEEPETYPDGRYTAKAKGKGRAR